ncbi:unnamed protein product [Amoebophrya sp. A25]|nr:unnamed protein product [Amoebophrya sp. A25]|eukprot:GSA25T00006012001.1
MTVPISCLLFSFPDSTQTQYTYRRGSLSSGCECLYSNGAKISSLICAIPPARPRRMTILRLRRCRGFSGRRVS